MDHLRTLVNPSPIGQLVLDRDGHVQLVNPAAAMMLGWSVNLTLPVDPAFADPVFAATFAELSRRAWLGEPQRSVEVSLVDGGQTRFLSASLVAETTDGDHLIVFFENITSRRDLERQLAQVQKMDSIGKLAGGTHSDGFITIDSAKGKGATFQVQLPVAKEEVAPTPKTVPAGGGDETILVVEDEVDVRSLVVQVLEVQGYQFTPPTTGSKRSASPKNSTVA